MGHKGCGLTDFPSCSVPPLLNHLFLFGLCRTEGVKGGQVKLMKDFWGALFYFSTLWMGQMAKCRIISWGDILGHLHAV